MKENIEVIQVEATRLKPNPWNSNYLSPENEKKLEASITRFGLYKPIICRELAGGVLEILGGQHRAAAAMRLDYEMLPVVNLGRIGDRQAKEIGLVDNGRYGEDDLLKLASVMEDIGGVEAVEFLPFTDKDLASLFEISKIDLEDLDLPDGEDAKGDLPETPRPTVTHQFVKFKLPLADVESVTKLLDEIVKVKGYDKVNDSMEAAGLALVDMAKAAKGHL